MGAVNFGSTVMISVRVLLSAAKSAGEAATWCGEENSAFGGEVHAVSELNELGKSFNFSKQREVLVVVDVHVEDLADVAGGVAFEDDDLVGSCATHEAGFVGLAGAFAEDLDALADEFFILGEGVLIDQGEQVLIAGFFDLLGDLNGFIHLGGGCAPALGVAEDKGVLELQSIKQCAGFLVVRFGLARKTNDDIGGDGDARAHGADALDKVGELRCGVGAVHALEDFIATTLNRKMDVFGELGQVGEGFDEILFIANGMRAGEADALDAGHFMHGFDKLYERALAIDGGELMTAIEVHDLAE